MKSHVAIFLGMLIMWASSHLAGFQGESGNRLKRFCFYGVLFQDLFM